MTIQTTDRAAFWVGPDLRMTTPERLLKGHPLDLSEWQPLGYVDPDSLIVSDNEGSTFPIQTRVAESITYRLTFPDRPSREFMRLMYGFDFIDLQETVARWFRGCYELPDITHVLNLGAMSCHDVLTRKGWP